MSKNSILPLLAAAIFGFLVYLAYTGVTIRDVRNWTARQLGGRVDAQDLKTMPAGGYSPIVPGR
jgi:hypothetical protein